MNHPLAQLVQDQDLLGSYWNQRHGLFRGAVPVDGLIDEQSVQQTLDTSLLRWPYYILLKDGQQPELTAFTSTREVDGQSVTGLADAAKIRRLLAAGATLKLNQLEDWHRPTRDLMWELEAVIPAELKAFVFYTPQDSTGMLPHRDGSHVLAIQLAGAKAWRIYDEPEQIDARSGLDVDVDSHSHAFVMEPGDVLYLPHGMPHVATARGGASLHLTFTITEPTPLTLAEALLTSFGPELDQLDLNSRMSPQDRAEAVVKQLGDQLASVPSHTLIATAVAQMRDRITKV